MKKDNKVRYRHKDGRLLRIEQLGAGEFLIVLVKEHAEACMTPVEWALEDILNACDGVYDEDGQFLAQTLEPTDVIVD